MGIAQRFERKLQAAIGDAFARVFGGGVVPQEVEAALQQEATDGVRQLDRATCSPPITTSSRSAKPITTPRSGSGLDCEGILPSP